jgi:hypothetical protein
MLLMHHKIMLSYDTSSLHTNEVQERVVTGGNRSAVPYTFLEDHSIDAKRQQAQGNAHLPRGAVAKNHRPSVGSFVLYESKWVEVG